VKDFKIRDSEIIKLLRSVQPFDELSNSELKSLVPILQKIDYQAGDVIVREGEIGSSAYIVFDGNCSLEIMGRKTKIFIKGGFFGEIALIDARPRMGTVRALTNVTLISIEADKLENKKMISSETAMKIYRGFARLITSYMREGAKLYTEMDVLLIQDGGCAPGYNPITAFISEYLGYVNRNVFIAAEGFKSIVSNKTENYRCLIPNLEKFKQLDHIPGVIYSRPLRERRGADFRCERYPEFKDKENQKIAVENILSRKIKVLIGIGGDGTFRGINALSFLLPKQVQIFFIPVTIDSDIYGTDCIGEYTGVEIGAEKIRCYMADARTHRRCYIIEMMGARGGYHALHSCLGAGAHLAVLPNSSHDLKKIAETLQAREDTVIVVAEGYKMNERKAQKYIGNAAEYFRDELLSTGLQTDQRVVCEGFSRDIRGAAPNNLDIMLAQRMARNLSRLISEGKSKLMPAVLSGKEYSIPFEKIRTDNSVESDLSSLANQLTV
jgi:6-phosphofructokinase 1